MKVLLHVEYLGDSKFAWWAESPEQPSFSAAGDTLRELVTLVREAADMEAWGPPVFEMAPPDAEQNAILSQPEGSNEYRLQLLAA